MCDMLTLKRITSKTDLVKNCYLKEGSFHGVSGIRIIELRTLKNPQQNGKQEDELQDTNRSKMLLRKKLLRL